MTAANQQYRIATSSSCYQECSRCVMDTSDPDITFNSEGLCNWCEEADVRLPQFQLAEEQSKRKLEELVRNVKAKQTNKYDSVIGLSGGVDSSYLAYWAHKAGLNPLAIHFDNGWNSETAISNIKKIIDVCGFDLQTYVINWQEFRDLQRSFLMAGVIDIEMVTDHAILSALRKLMRKNHIKFILSGANYATEHGLPPSWVWPKNDWKNIKNIHKQFGEISLKSYPNTGLIDEVFGHIFRLSGTTVYPLDHMNYRKSKAIEKLSRKFDWKYYGGKHYESLFTKFYQAYILPKKFGIDKRRSHLSCLIRTGEIDKVTALLELEKPLYDEISLREDKFYVCKKLGFSESELDSLIQQQSHSHLDYQSSQATRRKIRRIAERFSFLNPAQQKR